MSNANNFLQNMGVQMPMFASANQQTTSSDDVDLHDIFADYFNEDSNANEQTQLNNAFAAQQQQISLPTGQGIKTAWHSGSLPAMQQQGGSGVSNHLSGEPAAKRPKEEELLLPPSSQQQQIGQQQGMAMNNIGGLTGGGEGRQTTMTAQHQIALAQAASGVGALSGRLGFALQNNNNSGIAGIDGNVTGSMMAQQQGGGVLPTQQATQQHQQPQQRTSQINLPIGMGMKFSPTGGIMSQSGSVQSNGSAMAGINGGMDGGNNVGGGGVMANNVSNAMRVAVSNMQYGMTPSVSARPAAALQIMDKGRVEDQMAAERRLRNREHAKRSRVRKKFMLESLQQQVRGLQDENSVLRMLVQKHIPQEALKIIDDCCSKSVLFATGDSGTIGKESGEGSGEGGDVPQDACVSKETPLLRSDFSLIESLTSGQQNFVLSDPRLPDNPIVFASPGFYELTGYTREQVLGRNCRFLQGAGTDRKAVDVIRTAVANGTDATVCLLNYRADGTPFWNQLFVAALRDADNCIVNYVGVQTMVEPNAGASALEDKVNAAHPISVGVEDDNSKDVNR